MIFNLKAFLFILILLFILACTKKESPRLNLIATPPQQANLSCEKHHQIDFYLDCDIEFRQFPVMVLDFEFYKGNQQLMKGGTDPLKCTNITKESKKIKKGITRWKFYGKLEGNFIPPSDTIFNIVPTLIKNNQQDFIIHKMDLVFVYK